MTCCASTGSREFVAWSCEQEVHRRRAAVGAQFVQRDATVDEGVGHRAHLVGECFDERARDLTSSDAAAESGDRPARVAAPERRAESGEGRARTARPALSLNAQGERLEVRLTRR